MEDKKTVRIECETRGFDEATQEVEALAEAYDGFPAQVQLKGFKDCTINIYPSQTKFITINGDDDDGCMDMLDDEEEELYD